MKSSFKWIVPNSEWAIANEQLRTSEWENER